MVPAIHPREQFYEYWLDPSDPWEQPSNYVGRFERSRVLQELLAPHVTPSDEILEVGCGAGANLAYLDEHGYETLSGIELNPEMLELFETHYPETYRKADVRKGAIERHLPNLGTGAVDATVAVTVLAHVHPESARVFDEIVRATEDRIVTIENEETQDEFFVPRNYADVFEPRGCTQVDLIGSERLSRRTDLSQNCRARVFDVS